MHDRVNRRKGPKNDQIKLADYKRTKRGGGNRNKHRWVCLLRLEIASASIPRSRKWLRCKNQGKELGFEGGMQPYIPSIPREGTDRSVAGKEPGKQPLLWLRSGLEVLVGPRFFDPNSWTNATWRPRRNLTVPINCELENSEYLTCTAVVRVVWYCLLLITKNIYFSLCLLGFIILIRIYGALIWSNTSHIWSID